MNVWIDWGSIQLLVILVATAGAGVGAAYVHLFARRRGEVVSLGRELLSAGLLAAPPAAVYSASAIALALLLEPALGPLRPLGAPLPIAAGATCYATCLAAVLLARCWLRPAAVLPARKEPAREGPARKGRRSQGPPPA